MKNILTPESFFINLTKYYLPEGNVLTVDHNFGHGSESVNKSNAMHSAIKLIAHFFSPINALRGKPIFTITPESVIVHIFYYIPVTGQGLNNNTVNNLGETLSSLFNQTVELRIVKLHYPYLNSYILAQYIALNTQDYTLVQIARRIFGSTSLVKNTDDKKSDKILTLKTQQHIHKLLPSHIVGIKVRVSGRLISERSRPRQTVQTVQMGSFAKGNLSLVDAASFTSKNKKGAFTVKVWVAQRAQVLKNI